MKDGSFFNEAIIQQVEHQMRRIKQGAVKLVGEEIGALMKHQARSAIKDFICTADESAFDVDDALATKKEKGWI